MWLVAPSLFGMLAVSLDLDLVFSTNIHMILDTQGELQTLYFSLSTIFANVRWKLVESSQSGDQWTLPPVLDTYHRHSVSVVWQDSTHRYKSLGQSGLILWSRGGRLYYENWHTCSLQHLHAISNKTISHISPWLHYTLHTTHSSCQGDLSKQTFIMVPT